MVVLAAVAQPARAGQCDTPPTNGWGSNYGKYATWCTCCGGEPYSSPGVGCRKTMNWAKTECSGYSGQGMVATTSKNFMQAGAALAVANPEQAPAWLAAGVGLQIMMDGIAASSRNAQERKRAADAARAEEERRRAEEQRQRLEAMHGRLTRALKKDVSWAGESTSAPTVGSLALKTDTNVFGTRRSGGLALKKDDGESAKHASDRVELRPGPAPDTVKGELAQLSDFERLSLAFAETSNAAVDARDRHEEIRRRKEEAAKRREEAQARRDALRREREERRREVGKVPIEERDSAGGEPKPEPERPEPEKRDAAIGAPEKRDEPEGPDRLAEAEELLKIAIGEDEKQDEALKQAETDRAAAEKRMDEAKSRLAEHLSKAGGRG